MKLKDRKVLIIEDDYLQAIDYRAALEAVDCVVIGPISNEPAALELLKGEVPDGAIVELNLGSGLSHNLARALINLDIPFVFVTGYDRKDVPPEFSSVPCLLKPIDPSELLATLEAFVD